jgi:hypothetical protein
MRGEQGSTHFPLWELVHYCCNVVYKRWGGNARDPPVKFIVAHKKYPSSKERMVSPIGRKDVEMVRHSAKT